MAEKRWYIVVNVGKLPDTDFTALKLAPEDVEFLKKNEDILVQEMKQFLVKDLDFFCNQMVGNHKHKLHKERGN